MRLKITVDDKVYDVEVEIAEPDVAQAVRYVGSSSPSGSGNHTSAVVSQSMQSDRTPMDEQLCCRSPLAGVISEIKVQVGQTVEANQPVAVLEAMKMFTTITSPHAGVIKSIDVAVGDAVKQGQLLVEMEE